MENYNDIIHTISLAMGASWASGINLYATIFILFMIWLLPKLWRGLKKVFGFLGRLFALKKEDLKSTKIKEKLEG